MQKILRYELAVAMKDRSKAFQAVTLLLFYFSVTVVVVSSLIHLFPSERPKQVYTQVKTAAGYAGFAGAPANGLLHMKK